MPAVTFCAATTVPEPLACVSTLTCVAAPATRVSVPQLAPAAIPDMMEDPARVTLLLPTGQPRVGRTWTFCHVSLLVLPVPALTAVMEIVMLVVPTVATMLLPSGRSLTLLAAVAPPFTMTVTPAPGLNS